MTSNQRRAITPNSPECARIHASMVGSRLSELGKWKSWFMAISYQSSSNTRVPRGIRASDRLTDQDAPRRSRPRRRVRRRFSIHVVEPIKRFGRDGPRGQTPCFVGSTTGRGFFRPRRASAENRPKRKLTTSRGSDRRASSRAGSWPAAPPRGRCSRSRRESSGSTATGWS